MARHASLVRLSRDHHEALTLALRLRHPAPPHPVTSVTPASSPSLRARWTLDLYARALDTHFRAEETLLFPVLVASPALDDAGRVLVARLGDEHRRLAALRDEIAAASDDATLSPLLTAFGDLLEVHVRLEERQLFATITERVSADGLAALGPAIDAMLATRGGPSCAP